MAANLDRRLLQDIAELHTHPYPNIDLHISDGDLSTACLVLTTEYYGKIHLTIEFPKSYPFYICASILNTVEGYTPAYTLRGIAIQLLSFFCSDKIEQIDGGRTVELKRYGDMNKDRAPGRRLHRCIRCGYGTEDQNESAVSVTSTAAPGYQPKVSRSIQQLELPNEVLLMISDGLDDEDLMSFAKAWTRIGHLITTYDIIRTRELQCFVFKENFRTTELGIGVRVGGEGNYGAISSEFDLLSRKAYKDHHVHGSVQGLPFTYWLGLPISERHWHKVKVDTTTALMRIGEEAKLGRSTPITVVFKFMNDIVVRLNKEVGSSMSRQFSAYSMSPQSSLTHASEKAIEAYFHLFHLLCIATSDPTVVTSADALLNKFIGGATSKQDCPNLGHLLIASLISRVELKQPAIKAIIKEAITRNVVWTLDSKQGNMPELSYLEPSATSDYRLENTFKAGKVSYRLLMFFNAFRKTAIGDPRIKSLEQLKKEAFDRHGAPPQGAARGLSSLIRDIHKIDNFPDFLYSMGITDVPSKAWFCSFLKECVENSLKMGYHKMPLTLKQALALRLAKEPYVEGPAGMQDWELVGLDRLVDMRNLTFFPGNPKKKNRNWRR